VEQKRRTITTGRVSKKKDRRKIWAVLGVILGFIVIFAVSYGITYGLITSDEGEDAPGAAVSSSTEEDIANMSRADLEENYLKVKKQLEEKDAEIKMLKERLNQHEAANDETAPSTTTTPDENEDKEETSSDNSENESSAGEATPPPATDFSNEGLMSPEDLNNLGGATE